MTVQIAGRSVGVVGYGLLGDFALPTLYVSILDLTKTSEA